MSCYESKEGCLDLLATNYDVIADMPCDDCCTFPKVSINIQNINGQDTTYNLADTIYSLSGDSLQILEAKFYLSDITIYKNGSALRSSINIEDSITAKLFVDDTGIVSASQKNIMLGQFKFSGKPDTITCRLGLNPDINQGVFTKVASGHPLNARNKIKDPLNQNASLYVKYRSFSGTSLDTQVVYIKEPITKFLTWRDVSANAKGDEIKVNLQVNYAILMSRIRKNMSYSEAISAIQSNIDAFINVK